VGCRAVCYRRLLTHSLTPLTTSLLCVALPFTKHILCFLSTPRIPPFLQDESAKQWGAELLVVGDLSLAPPPRAVVFLSTHPLRCMCVHTLIPSASAGRECQAVGCRAARDRRPLTRSPRPTGSSSAADAEQQGVSSSSSSSSRRKRRPAAASACCQHMFFLHVESGAVSCC
jgi:hypothetical protein